MVRALPLWPSTHRSRGTNTQSQDPCHRALRGLIALRKGLPYSFRDKEISGQTTLEVGLRDEQELPRGSVLQLKGPCPRASVVSILFNCPDKCIQ